MNSMNEIPPLRVKGYNDEPAKVDLTDAQMQKIIALADETMQVLLSICEDETSGLSVEECKFFYRAIADGFNDEVGE